MSHIRHIQRNMARTALAAEGGTKVNRRLSADKYIKGVTKVNRRLSADKYIKGWTKTWRQAADDCVQMFSDPMPNRPASCQGVNRV